MGKCEWKHTDWNCPLWPGTAIMICVLLYDRRSWQATTNRKSSEKVARRCHVCFHLPESFSLASILTEQCMHHQSEQLAKDNPETNPTTIKPEIPNQGEEQLSWVSLPCCSLPGCPFPIKSFALPACVSPWIILLWVSDKCLLSGPGSTEWLSAIEWLYTEGDSVGFCRKNRGFLCSQAGSWNKVCK